MRLDKFDSYLRSDGRFKTKQFAVPQPMPIEERRPFVFRNLTPPVEAALPPTTPDPSVPPPSPECISGPGSPSASDAA